MSEKAKGMLSWNKKNRRRLFIFLMLAYPLFHFLFFWVFINFDSVLLSFQSLTRSDDYLAQASTWSFVGLKNYKLLFEEIFVNKYTRQMIFNSLSYVVLNVGVILPLSILASFILFKRLPLSRFFRVMFFLPSIIPLAALMIAFKAMIDPQQGSLSLLIQTLGFEAPGFLTTTQSSQFTIYLFMMWSGMGFNIILLSSAMARMPMEVLESGKLDGVKGFKELFLIYIPLIWPNITTMVMLGLMSTFTVALQPMMMTGNINETIGLRIFSNSMGNTNLSGTAALGIVCTLVAAPIVLLIRFIMERFNKDVAF